MTQEEKKELLLQDLCARVPYGIKCSCYDGRLTATLTGVKSDTELYFHEFDWKEDNGIIEVEFCKPYLFPLSSMSEEQKEELITITNGKFRYMCGDITNAIPRKNSGEWGISENAYIHDIKVINILYIWLLKNHFDINGLIPMGLANDATGLNIY